MGSVNSNGVPVSPKQNASVYNIGRRQVITSGTFSARTESTVADVPLHARNSAELGTQLDVDLSQRSILEINPKTKITQSTTDTLVERVPESVAGEGFTPPVHGNLPNGSAGGDLAGEYPNPEVVALSGVSIIQPASGEFLQFDGTEYVGAQPTVNWPVAGGDLNGIYPNPLVVGLSGAPIIQPATSEVLIYDGTNYTGSGIPVSLPPNGPAGGDLGGTYPNPTVANIAGASSINTTTLNVGNNAIISGIIIDGDSGGTISSPGMKGVVFGSTLEMDGQWIKDVGKLQLTGDIEDVEKLDADYIDVVTLDVTNQATISGLEVTSQLEVSGIPFQMPDIAGHSLVFDGTSIIGSGVTGGGGGGGAGTPFLVVPAASFSAPLGTDIATFSTRNVNGILNFDDSTSESGMFSSVMSIDYDNSSDVNLKIYWTPASASGLVKWDVRVENQGDFSDGIRDIDDWNFGPLSTVTTETTSSSGVINVSAIALDNANMDVIAAEDPFRVVVIRDVAVGNNMTGDAQVLYASMGQ